jgi:hypothetical protein
MSASSCGALAAIAPGEPTTAAVAASSTGAPLSHSF